MCRNRCNNKLEGFIVFLASSCPQLKSYLDLSLSNEIFDARITYACKILKLLKENSKKYREEYIR
jgi:hypothetical protein